MTRIRGILYEGDCTFMTIFLSVLLRTRRNIQTIAVEGIETYISCPVTFFEYFAVYLIVLKNFVHPDRPR